MAEIVIDGKRYRLVPVEDSEPYDMEKLVPTLSSLVGTHILSAVGRSTMKHPTCNVDLNCFIFTLDGITYQAIEDENDGWSSCMSELRVIQPPLGLVPLPDVQVLCRMGDRARDCEDVLEMIDVVNGKTVLRVGTDRFDSWYPRFINEWIPENLYCNTGA